MQSLPANTSDRSEARRQNKRTVLAATSEIFRILARINYVSSGICFFFFNCCVYEAVVALKSKSARIVASAKLHLISRDNPGISHSGSLPAATYTHYCASSCASSGAFIVLAFVFCQGR